MTPSRDEFQTTSQGAAQFATTHWSVVLTAGRRSSPQARDALETLCRTYWYPLYAFIRRQGRSPHDAQDLTQEFFARFLEKDFLGDVHRERGRFRAFLRAALKHFLANEWDRVRARKRGGGRTLVSLDARDAENRYAFEPRDDLSADRIYERRWAMLLLELVLGRLRQEFAAAGKTSQFELLKDALSADRGALPQAEIAARLKMTEEAVRVAVHRLRKRYRELLRAEVAQTVGCPEDIDDEIRHLFAVLSG